MKALTPSTNMRKCQTRFSDEICSRCLTPGHSVSNREFVTEPLFAPGSLPLGSVRGCRMIKHVDIQSPHIIVAIQPLPVVGIRVYLAATVTLRNEIHNQLPKPPLSSVHNPAFALRTVIFCDQLCSEVTTPRRHTTQMNAESLKNTVPSQFSNPACITG